jgi:hypothetical protein
VRRRTSLALLCFPLLASALLPEIAEAQDEPPPVKRTGGGGGGGGSRIGAKHIGGDQGIRPFLGVSGDLGVDIPTSVSGNKFLFGVDYYIGPPTGLSYALGLHLGAGGGAFVLHPLFQIRYGFALGIPLVPWIGGGGGIKLGFARHQSANLAITFRFIAGVEYFLTDSIGLGMELALPDLGPRLAPSVAVVGTVEWTIGPHFRF